MEKYKWNNGIGEVSKIAMGCMRIPELESIDKVQKLIETAMESGIDFFDHADIYGNGKAEEMFGRAISSSIRQKIKIQTKCGIRIGKCFDFSKDYIIKSVEGSLKRLNTDYIDVLLLHRPDALMEVEEISEAFDILHKSGKVKAFGVSNQNVMQMELMRKYCNQEIIINQIQMSIAHCPSIDAGFNVNICNDASIDRDGGLLPYCQMNDIKVQAWSPFQYGMFAGTFIDNPKFERLNQTLDNLAEKYQVSKNAIAIAWILRHPVHIQPISGSINIDRVREIAKASDIKLTREEWYELYMAAGKQLP